MDVNSTTAIPVSQPLNSPQQPVARNDKPEQEQQESTVVKLSEQARLLNQAENQNVGPQPPAPPTQQPEPPGIEFLATDNKGSQVDTFA